MIVAGIDPAATSRRPSGVAVISNTTLLFIGKAYYDQEIIDIMRSTKPVVVAIDAPLSPSDKYREVDLLMKRSGYPVLPPGWKTMRLLVIRGMKLRETLQRYGIAVIETHPKSALKSSRCSSPDELFSRTGINPGKRLTRDEEDALIAALVAKYYVEGKARSISAVDGVIYLLPEICGE